MDLFITTDGNTRCLYDDLISLAFLGEITIRRASHVDPDGDGNWWADLAPSSGPVLGPFTTRGDALRAETEWLIIHVLKPGEIVCSGFSVRSIPPAAGCLDHVDRVCTGEPGPVAPCEDYGAGWPPA
jgi:hypothetical protein